MMRVSIPTQQPVKDRDVRVLYIIQYALSLLEKRMIIPTLEFFADREGFKVVKK